MVASAQVLSETADQSIMPKIGTVNLFYADFDFVDGICVG